MVLSGKFQAVEVNQSGKNFPCVKRLDRVAPSTNQTTTAKIQKIIFVGVPIPKLTKSAIFKNLSLTHFISFVYLILSGTFLFSIVVFPTRVFSSNTVWFLKSFIQSLFSFPLVSESIIKNLNLSHPNFGST